MVITYVLRAVFQDSLRVWHPHLYLAHKQFVIPSGASHGNKYGRRKWWNQCITFNVGTVMYHTWVKLNGLKARFLKHRWLRTITADTSQDVNIDQPVHCVNLEMVSILAVEPRWFERSVKEAIHIRVGAWSLNMDGGCYNLPPMWNNHLKKWV